MSLCGGWTEEQLFGEAQHDRDEAAHQQRDRNAIRNAANKQARKRRDDLRAEARAWG